MKLSDSGRLLNILRLAASLLLALPLYLYLSDIIVPLFAAAAVVAAFAAGLAAVRLRLRFIPAAAVFFLSALLLRSLLTAVVGITGAAVDSASFSFSVFRFDSGFFPLLPLFLYVAVFTFLSARRRRLAAVEVLLNIIILTLLMWSQGGYRMTLFPHPGMLAGYGIIFFVIELTVLMLTVSVLSPGSRFRFLCITVPLFILAVILLFGRYSEGASKDGGGLMQPTLFRFDFSDYVKLETEISMDNDLVMLFRNYGYLNSVYLRRFYLSGYKAERGFFIKDGPGEMKQMLNLPDRYTETDGVRYPRRIESEQEYFIVNFDPSSLIAMNYPVRISPLTNWSGSSFLRNYRVVSESVELPSWELAEAPVLRMDSGLLEFYTEYGGDVEIRRLAEEITSGIENPYDKVIAIMFYLHDAYYYSLKPGVAPDGNQLHYFLFDSKKGYCSYFAFSMALMCRSLGIPARVAAGFFVDPQSGILNVYPVREDMAHAWVEVAFEDYGWVEFDPTTDRLAPGEELEFGALDSREYAELVEEIFSNEYGIEEAAEDPQSETDPARAAIRAIGRLIRRNAALLIPLLYFTAIAIFRIVEALQLRTSDVERMLKARYRRAMRLSRAAGCGRRRGESALEHSHRIEAALPGIGLLAESYLESVFSRSEASRLKAEAAAQEFDAGWRRIPAAKRLLIFIFPFIRFRKPSGAFPVILVLIALCSFTAVPAAAEDRGSAEDYIDLAAREQDAENYEAALNLLNEGISLYPSSAGLKAAAGDLYSDRELYNLALEQYRAALQIDSADIEVLYSKSAAEGFLNLDEDSISTLERILGLDPENYDALADLGWMYFKTFRLREAEALLLDAIEIYDDSPILKMTLGTVYSGLYEYEAAERYYLESIESALEKGWNYFASVSYYNLSLLEHGFYNYGKALEYTNKSIEHGERAPGYISRAEIYLGKLDFQNASLNYQQAYRIDSTPLALMGLADLYLTFGMLEEALSHINEVLKHDDDSWMYYFGVDPERHRMETDRLLMRIYEAMANRERYMPLTGPARLVSLFKRAGYSARSWFHGRRYRSASFDVGSSNERQGNRLDAAWAFYIANEDYGNNAVRYLSRASAIETAAAPEAEGSYLLEEGLLRKDPGVLGRAAALLDPEWERLKISEALAGLLKLGRRQVPDKLTPAVRLYRMNPSVFVTEAIKFPLAADFKPGFCLSSMLRRSGFNILLNNTDSSYRYRLTAADKQDGGVLYTVVDSETGETLAGIELPQRPDTFKKASAFCAELKMRLFSISDGKAAPL